MAVKSLALIAGIALATPVFAQGIPPTDASPAPAAAAALNDDQLSCAQVKTEWAAQNAQLDALGKEMEGVTSVPVRPNVGAQAGKMMATNVVSSVAGTLLPGGVGAMVGAGVKALSSATSKPDNQAGEMMGKLQPTMERFTQASQRLQSLQSIYEKKCVGASGQ